MKKYTYIYCVVAIVAMVATLFPTHCYANIDIFNDGNYNAQYNDAIFGTTQATDNSQLSGISSFESLKTNSSWSGELVKPFGEARDAFATTVERQNGNSKGGVPDGEATDEIPVGEGLLVLLAFMMFLFGARRARREATK